MLTCCVTLGVYITSLCLAVLIYKVGLIGVPTWIVLAVKRQSLSSTQHTGSVLKGLLQTTITVIVVSTVTVTTLRPPARCWAQSRSSTVHNFCSSHQQFPAISPCCEIICLESSAFCEFQEASMTQNRNTCHTQAPIIAMQVFSTRLWTSPSQSLLLCLPDSGIY